MKTPTKEEAIKIIVSEVVKVKANALMESGTVGGLQKLTKREGEAGKWARYYVEKTLGYEFSGHLEPTEKEIEGRAIVNEIKAAVIAITGK